jgi:hypothetical protein
MPKILLLALILALNIPHAQANDEVPFERVFDTIDASHPKFLSDLNAIVNGDMLRWVEVVKVPYSINTLVAAGYVAAEIVYFEMKQKNKPCGIEVRFKKENQPTISLYYKAYSSEFKSRCQ